MLREPGGGAGTPAGFGSTSDAAHRQQLLGERPAALATTRKGSVPNEAEEKDWVRTSEAEKGPAGCGCCCCSCGGGGGRAAPPPGAPDADELKEARAAALAWPGGWRLTGWQSTGTGGVSGGRWRGRAVWNPPSALPALRSGPSPPASSRVPMPHAGANASCCCQDTPPRMHATPAAVALALLARWHIRTLLSHDGCRAIPHAHASARARTHTNIPHGPLLHRLECRVSCRQPYFTRCASWCECSHVYPTIPPKVMQCLPLHQPTCNVQHRQGSHQLRVHGHHGTAAIRRRKLGACVNTRRACARAQRVSAAGGRLAGLWSYLPQRGLMLYKTPLYPGACLSAPKGVGWTGCRAQHAASSAGATVAAALSLRLPPPHPSSR